MVAMLFTAQGGGMTTNVRAHYEEVLGPVYTWTLGDAEAQLDASRRFFARHGIAPGVHRGALDLGAGSGRQSIPLAELGFSVTAVDVSPTLLAELRARAGALDVRTVERDFLPLHDLVAEPQAVVVCAGDTLSHLADHSSVEALIAGAACVLGDAGRLVLTWRELQELPAGDARFIPVRSTADRVFVCFLEEIDDEHVRVTDIVHERSGDGFTQRVGSYTKLRVSAAGVDTLLARHGFCVEVASVEGTLATRIARRAR
jgi:SAM-dependent methyltransferase